MTQATNSNNIHTGKGKKQIANRNTSQSDLSEKNVYPNPNMAIGWVLSMSKTYLYIWEISFRKLPTPSNIMLPHSLIIYALLS